MARKSPSRPSPGARFTGNHQKLHEVRQPQEGTVADLVEFHDLEVLDGQRSLFSAELTLAQTRGNECQSLVQLYRSLGGGWQR